MKKFLALAALVLGLASCQTEPEGLDVNVGGAVDTVVTVNIPEVETRANDSGIGIFENGILESDDYTMRYMLQIFYGDKPSELYVRYSDNQKVSFPVRLVPGEDRDYNFVVWADIVEQVAGLEDDVKCDDLHYAIGDDLREISVNDDKWVAMDETRDAFTAVKLVENYTGSQAIDIDLYRPFAKLRVITTDMVELTKHDIIPTTAVVTYKTKHRVAYNALTGEAADASATKEHSYTIAAYGDNTETDRVLFTDYFFADDEVVQFDMLVKDQDNKEIVTRSFNTDIFVKRNYLTTLKGDILTNGTDVNVTVKPGFDGESGKEDGKTFANVDTAEELFDAINKGIENITVEDDIDLNDLLTAGTLATRATTDPSLAIKAGKKINIDLGGFTLSATSSQTGKNYDMIDVRGTLSIKNGAIECKHEGNNMEWNNSTNVFNITAGGVLNLDSVTAKNLGGSDMAFVAHLNNWGEVTLNVDNSTLESTYVAVRVFNSGNDMNNVTIKNSTLMGGKHAFWVHNYTLADFGNDADKTAAQKALLNLNIYNQNNTFIPDVDGIRYGKTNSIKSDSYGITKSVSEDGTIVTLGAILEDAVLRQGVAGYENSTIKKVVVGEGIAVLENRCFRKFHALEEVVLPAGLTTIGVKEKGNNDTTGTGMFQGCENLKTIIIPETVTTIDAGSFYGCSALETINIPSGITRIEESSLRATGLKNIVFHEGVTYFGQYAFRDCENLEEIYINAPSFTIESNTFLNAAAPYPHFTIYVVNTEMKDYLESVFDAHTKTFITVKGPEVVADKEEIKEALDSALADGETNVFIDANGANIGDLNYGLSKDKIPAGTTVTIRNAEVSGSSYGNSVDGTVIFEGCTFNNAYGAYSIHFDSGSGDVIFKNCHLYGWNSFGASLNSVTFENCSLHGNGSYALIRSYVTLTLTNCTIDVSNANHTDGYSEGVEAVNDATLTMTNTKYEASNTNGLKAAVAAGAPVVGLKAGVYDTKDFQIIGKTLTLTGIDEGVKIFNSQNNDVASGAFDGCKMTFNNLTIETIGGFYKGFARMEGVYNNCNFVNNYFTFFGKHEFNGCKFTASAPTNEHCLWTYGASELNFTECEFTYGDRCVNCYSDNDVPGGQTVNFTKCTFTTENTASLGAVEINSCFIKDGIVVNLDGCTAPAYGELAWVSKWDSTNGAKTTINIK